MNRFSLRQWLTGARPARGRRRHPSARRAAHHRAARGFEGLEERRLLSINWNNPNGGNWDDPNNWVGGAVPGPSDNVVINTASTATITIQSGDAESVLSLTTSANDTLSIAGGSLTVAADSTLSGPLSIDGGSLTATGAGVTLLAGGTTTASGAGLMAAQGAVFDLPNLTSYTSASNVGGNSAISDSAQQIGPAGAVLGGSSTIEADDNGSQVNLPNLTALDGADVVVTAGGLVNMSKLTQVTTGFTSFQASDPNSAIDLSALTTATASTIAAHNGANILAGKLSEMSDADLTLDGGGTFDAANLSSLTRSSLNIDGSLENLALNQLTTIASSRVFVSGGAAVSAPQVTSATCAAGATAIFQATDAGSTLSLPKLAGLTVDLSGETNVRIFAFSGGAVNLPTLTDIRGGAVALASDGAGSIVDVSNLTDFESKGGSISATNGGTIKHPVPGTGGPLRFNAATSGAIGAASLVNDWTFLGQAGQGVTITVSTGSQGSMSPWPPTLDDAQVSLTDSKGNVLATASTSQPGTDVVLQGVALPALGAYHILVQAPQALVSASGDYVIDAVDVTLHQFTLPVNRMVHGALDSDASVDNWTFSAAANTQVQFNLIANANPAIEFDLTGPNGFTAFSNSATSSSLITLPSSGNYVLTVHNATGAYAFEVNQTPQANLTIGTPFQGNLNGSGQAQLFTITVTNATVLQISFMDPNAADHNELYFKAGAPPTRDVYDSRSVVAATSNQSLVVVARPGTYYVLAYDDFVQADGTYSLAAQSAPFIVTGMTPTTAGNGFDTTLKFTGAFLVSQQAPQSGPGVSNIDNQPTLQFIGSGGIAFPAAPIPIYSTAALDSTGLPIVAATLPAHILPAGDYSVRITDKNGYSVTVPTTFKVVDGGVAVLHTEVIVPNPVGYHISSTIYVKYSNDGNAAMPAPLLVVTAFQKGLEGAFLTLDPTLVTDGFYTDTNPAGYSQEVQFLASGATPGILQPGETVTVPVYYGGWLHSQWDFSRPPITFVVEQLDTSSTDPIDWPSLKDGLRPGYISADAWNAVFANFVANVGDTVASYQAALDADATYLGQIGEPTSDVARLAAYEVNKANDAFSGRSLNNVVDASLPTPGLALTFQRQFLQSISGRYQMGTLGRGWVSNWNVSAFTDAQGNVSIDEAGVPRTFGLRADGSFQAAVGDHGTLTSIAAGGYELLEPNGDITAFNADGTLNYVQDSNRNRITATYTSGLLTKLTHANGSFLSFSYTNGLLTQVQDSSGRVGTYTYDATGQHLLMYTDQNGTTTYSYVTGQGAPSENSLASIAYGDGTHVFFGYDSEGRPTSERRDNNQEALTFSYPGAGGISVTDASGATRTTLLNDQGMISETIDPLGAVTAFTYGADFKLKQVNGPLGNTFTYTTDSLGDVTSITDPLGRTDDYSYDSAGRLTSYTDALGNATSYQRDGRGNLLSITYPNASLTQFSYDPLGDLTQAVNRRGNAINYVYNTAGQVVERDFADGSKQTYTYDAHGNMLTATDASGTITLKHTNPANSDLVTEIDYPNGQFLQFSYNSVGKRTQSVDQSGFTINYQYDAVGRLAELTDGGGAMIVQYGYDLVGRLIQKDLGNGTRTTYQYDADGNLLTLVNLAPDHVTVNSQYDYTYDALGRVVTMTTGDVTTTYGYDADSQLTSINTTGLSIQYSYDPAGNRLTETVNGVTNPYTVNNLNEYAAVGGTTYQYDADGNLISKTDGSGTTNYSYDQESRLTGVSGPGVTATYAYDPLGNRFSATVNGVTTQSLIDGGNVASQYDGSGHLIAHYTQGLGLVSQVDAGNSAAFYDFDAIGDAVGITNASGIYVNQYSYLPFGETTVIGTPQLNNPFTFVGQFGVTSDASGTFDMRYRNYDPSTGQFLSNDPLGTLGTDTNIRRYAANEPTNATDPVGLQEVPVNAWDDTSANGGGQTGGGAPAGSGLPGSGGGGAASNFSSGSYTGGSGGNYGSSMGSQGFVVPNTSNGPPPGMSLNAGSVDAQYQAQQQSLQNQTNQQNNQYSQYPYQNQSGSSQQQYNNTQPTGSNPNTGPWKDTSTTGVPKQQSYSPPAQTCPAGPGLIQVQSADSMTAIDSAAQPADAGCDGLDTTSGGTSSTTAVTSQDPNSLLGPAGFGSAGFIPPGAIMPYRINFENDPAATAPAQRVDISDQLDPGLDLSTFQLTGISWGNINLTIPADTQHFSDIVPMIENGESFVVDVSAQLNTSTGLLTISFQSVDPNTNLPPDVLTGFLPPDDSTPTGGGTGRGLGYVAYIVDAKAGLPTGTQIRNVAFVTFDQGETIATDQVDEHDPTKGIDPTKQALNTIDAGAPTSSVTALPATETATSFTVSWAGTDDAGGSGIASFDVFVSDDGGPFTPFETATNSPSATFNGVNGHTYRFFSVATDNVGNRQPTPTAAQAITTVASAVTVLPISSVTPLAALSPVSFTVSWSGSDVGGPGIASFDVFVSDNGGPFTSFLTGTTAMSATYKGVNGHTYGFFSVATDAAGHRQPTPAAAQATTQVVADVNELYVEAVYEDVLSRLPDSGGLQYWTQLLDSGKPVSSVAELIAHSDEYYANFVIRPAYLNLLGRAAEDAGVKVWTAQMDAGTTDQQLEADIVSSPEFYTKAGGTNIDWIDAVYKFLLGRAPDAGGENYWNGKLAAGQTLNQVAQGIAGSQENDTQLINEDYFHYLGRGADAGGLAYWLKQFADGQTNEDVIAGFTGSVEYYKDHTS